jgi:outer membrane murein-binding lipoprotein Lpp
VFAWHQIIEFETALLDVQAYERKVKTAEADKEAAGTEAAQAKLDKVTFKLYQSEST